MAHRISKGGSYRIDRVFPGVGRIAIASGATTKAGFTTRNNLLSRLFEKGRLDILRAIKKGEVTLTESLEADRAENLDSLVGPRKALSRNIWTSVDTWVPSAARSTSTRKRYRVSLDALKQRGPCLFRSS